MIQFSSKSDIKTIIFENEVTYQSEKQELEIASDVEEIDIRHIIDSFKEKNSIFMPLEWKIFDPKLLCFKVIDIEKPLMKIYLYSPTIMLKYKELTLPDSDCDSVNSKGSTQSKKERNKERTIRDVIQRVKQWRQIHNSFDKYKNKINLYDAAKAVGIAKKSLDDYFCQLRLAQQYGFNFFDNLDKKIGVLRAYVRKNRPNGQQSTKHQRLPRKLRIIEQFSSDFNYTQKQFKQKQKQLLMQQQPFQSIMQSEYQPPMSIILQDQLQNRFLNSFNFMMDDPVQTLMDYGYKRSNSNTSNLQSIEYLFF